MNRKTTIPLLATLLSLPACGDEQGFGEDYYLGFSQGAYYGLMLAGEDYHVAWCMKSELEYEAAELGGGGEFQSKLQEMLDACREANPVEDRH